ncbi:hypothetical protein GJ496_010239 [Pomphorhynchus laevis]|nr:hypothetical protein GJ496_010239 [Pomphorhynchus laevis]
MYTDDSRLLDNLFTFILQMSETVDFDNDFNEIEEVLDSSDNLKTEEIDDYSEKKDVNGSSSALHKSSKSGMKNEPSKVVHIALIPPIVRDEDLAFIGLAFGEITMLLYIRKKRNAMICFERLEDAKTMVNYFSKFPGEMFHNTLSIEFSNHKELNFRTMSRNVANTQTILQKAKDLKKIAEEGILGSVIRVVAKSTSIILTMESLYKTFCEFGVILKIVISKRSNSTEAFVQLSDIESAKKVMAAYEKHKLSKIEVNIAREQCLNVRFNNARSRDFTNPTLMTSSDMDSQTSICLSAGIQLAEGSDSEQNIIQHLSRLVGIDIDRSLSGPGRDDKRRYLNSGELAYEDMSSSKRRRSDHYINEHSDEQFEDSWLSSGHRTFDDFAGIGRSVGGRHSSPSYAARNPQPSNAAFLQSLASGRLDGGTISAAKQILAERAMSAIANDPYAKLLNSFISSSGGRSGFSNSDSFSRNFGDSHSLRRYSFQDDPYNMVGGMNYESREDRGGKVLFVSNLNSEKVNPDALFTLFGVYGDVQRVKLMFTRSGSALVQMNTSEQAFQAITHLNGITIYGKRMRITLSKYSQVQVSRDPQENEQWSKNYENSTLHRYRHPGSRNCKNIYPPSEFLHLSNICDDTGKDELQRIFEQYGKVMNIRFFVTDRRMGVVEMDSISTACEALIGAHNCLLDGGRRVRISFANQKR